jgi:levansucrase
MTSAWTTEHVMGIADQQFSKVPLVTKEQVHPIIPGIMLWDMWPIQLADGSIAEIAGGSIWMALSAEDHGDPARRHFDARIRLLHLVNDQWKDLGQALPDQASPYEREWAGTALLKNNIVSLFFTAAGNPDVPRGYQQRLFEAHGALQSDGRISDWTTTRESVTNCGEHYEFADQQDGEPGKIVAFRDPAYFRDPADDKEYLLFSASLGRSTSDYNGAIGIAERTGTDSWKLLPPLAHADGVNNEMERAHMVVKDGLYYLFWVTQSGTFNPDLPVGATGLYGMVANSLFGDYRPLNGTGLVIGNPPEEPTQTYSWHVTKELLVSSFIDHWGLGGRSMADHPELAAESFGGTPAPFLTITLDGEIATLSDTGVSGFAGRRRA